MAKEQKFPTIAKAIRTAREQLAKMPPAAEVRLLQTELGSIASEVDGWASDSPEWKKREDVMKRVMAIHLSIVTRSREA